MKHQNPRLSSKKSYCVFVCVMVTQVPDISVYIKSSVLLLPTHGLSSRFISSHLLTIWALEHHISRLIFVCLQDYHNSLILTI